MAAQSPTSDAAWSAVRPPTPRCAAGRWLVVLACILTLVARGPSRALRIVCFKCGWHGCDGGAAKLQPYTACLSGLT
eukprot:COSAG01_NODE_3399_length_6142_cov_11.969236_7_plen_77_part_00